MISWDRCGDSIIGVFSPRQVRWLREHLTDYRDRVDSALSGQGGDPVLSAVFAKVVGDYHFRLERAWTAITTLLGDLPPRGGVVEICDDPKRVTWIWILQDLRIAVAVRLGSWMPGSSDAAGKLQAWLSKMIGSLVEEGDLLLLSTGNHDDS